MTTREVLPGAVLAGITWWFYLSGILTLLGAQLNVVLRDGLWPRSLRSRWEVEMWNVV